MRCDESPHGFRAGAATPGCGKAEVRTLGLRESGGATPGLRESGGATPELRGCGKAELVFWFRSSLYFV
ncbi:hypothetical protein PAXRUDRAFT_836103, partial [Paxillus rubicundulus Ve08.2h10]